MKNKFLTSEILNFDQLDNVAGGTFTPNEHKEAIYNQAGVRTNYNILFKDEFWIKDYRGREVPVTKTQANWVVDYWKKKGVQPFYEQVALKCKD